MKTEIDKFRKKIDLLMRDVEAAEKEVDVTAAVSEHHLNHDVYHSIASNILKHLIEPRMELVADMFQNASVEVNANIGYVRLSFISTRLPATFYLLFCLRLDHSARMVRLYAESCLRPYTFDYKPSGFLAIPLSSPNLKKAETFIEDQILEFLKGYLRFHYEEKVEKEAIPHGTQKN